MNNNLLAKHTVQNRSDQQHVSKTTKPHGMIALANAIARKRKLSSKFFEGFWSNDENRDGMVDIVSKS